MLYFARTDMHGHTVAGDCIVAGDIKYRGDVYVIIIIYEFLLLLLVPLLIRVRRYDAVKKDLVTHPYGGGMSLIEIRLTLNTTMDNTIMMVHCNLIE